MKVFDDRLSLESHLASEALKLKIEIAAENEDRLLGADEAQYESYFTNRFHIEPPMFHWDRLEASVREEAISGHRFPRLGFHVKPDGMYVKEVIRYHLPVEGSDTLLRRSPPCQSSAGYELTLVDGSICFDIVNWRGDPAEVKRDADGVLGVVRRKSDTMVRRIEQWNDDLEEVVRTCLRDRKKEILGRRQLVAGLGVALKPASDVPDTFTVPIRPRRIIVKKPATPDGGYKPEPVLEMETYDRILRHCRELGVAMERHPNTYRDKDEEALRDLFIMVLTPQFESVSGETFNKSGKTDILVRHEGRNLFVAECKIWRGAAAFSEAIDQALGYLTWRDSKAALLVFVPNKKLQPVLTTVEQETQKHKCFVNSRGMVEEGWHAHRFHLPEDTTRGAELAVLCFHFPI